MRQPHKLVKHTQIIRRLLTTNYFSVSGDYVRLALKGLISGKKTHLHTFRLATRTSTKLGELQIRCSPKQL